jgi:hypothetical protein
MWKSTRTIVAGLGAQSGKILLATGKALERRMEM